MDPSDEKATSRYREQSRASASRPREKRPPDQTKHRRDLLLSSDAVRTKAMSIDFTSADSLSFERGARRICISSLAISSRSPDSSLYENIPRRRIPRRGGSLLIDKGAINIGEKERNHRFSVSLFIEGRFQFPSPLSTIGYPNLDDQFDARPRFKVSRDPSPVFPIRNSVFFLSLSLLFFPFFARSKQNR